MKRLMVLGLCCGIATAMATEKSVEDQSLELRMQTANANPTMAKTHYDYPNELVVNASRQGGDDIANAVAIASLPFTSTGTTVGYTDDYDEVCPYTDSTAPDVVYSVDVLTESWLSVDLLGSEYDTKTYIYASDGTTVVACNDDYYSDYTSAIPYAHVDPGTYYIVIDGYGTDSGAYALAVDAIDVSTCTPYDCTGVPDEGEPVYTEEDTVNGGCNLDTPLFGTLGAEMCGTFFTYVDSTDAELRDMDWFEVTLTESSTITLDGHSCAPYGMWILTDCDDEAPAFVSGFGDATVTSDCLDIGTYIVAIAPIVFNGLETPVGWHMDVTLTPCSLFDPCDDPVVINVGDTITADLPAEGNNFFGSDCTGYSHNGPDDFYELTLAADAFVVIEQGNADPECTNDYTLYLTTVCGSIDDIIGCSDSGTPETIAMDLTAGTYYIVADFYSTSPSDCQYTLSVSSCEDWDCTGLTLENEPVYDGDDTFNGGCNAATPAYTAFSAPGEICGTFFTYVHNTSGDDMRDEDWYEVVLTEPGDVTAAAQACTEYYLYLYDSECSSLGYAYGFGELSLEGWLPAGTYYLMVRPYAYTGVNETVYHIETTFTANDPCETPFELTCGGSYTGSNVGLVDFLGYDAGDAVGYFTLATRMFVDLSLCDAGTDYDTYLRVFDGSPCAAGTTQLYYNDDGATCAATTLESVPSEILGMDLEAGTYWVVVEGYGYPTAPDAEEGNFVISMTCVADAAPPEIVHTPIEDGVDGFGPYTISAEVTDELSAVASVDLFYRTTIGDFTEVAMTNTAGDTYEATIPALALGEAAEYYIYAADASANEDVTDTYLFWPIDYMLAPENVDATDGEFTLEVSWDAPTYAQGALGLPEGMFYESFETGIPATWTIINADGGDQWQQYTSAAYDGDACAAVTYDVPNDDWLITPAIEPTAVSMLDFYAKPGSSYYPDEVLEVLISTTDADTASFTLIEELDVNDYYNWTNYQYDLSSYAGGEIYIAFHCTSDDQLRLLLDLVTVNDIAEPTAVATSWSVEPRMTVEDVFSLKNNTMTKDEIAQMLAEEQQAERAFVGYNVYRDTNFLGSTTDLYYIDDTAVAGNTYSYTVTAVWDAGESAVSGADTGFIIARPTQGGPDGFGYTWESSLHPGGSVAYEWIAHTAAAVDIDSLLTDDGDQGPIAIGFDFPFYGDTMTELWIASNGLVGFTDVYFTYTNQDLPSTTSPNNLIGLFWGRHESCG